MQGVLVQLLGGLSVQVGGEDVTPAIGGRVGQLAFAYLVLNRHRPVRRDELAAAIWEDRAPADPDAALRVVLTRLRKALGADALQGRAELRVELPEPAEVDVERVRATSDSSALAAMTEHELLPGLEADWVSAERDALEAIRIGALLALGEAALSEGDAGRAEQAARRLIALAPFREGGHQLLIKALAARGELAQALSSYEEVRVLLRDELGIGPSPELAGLHMELLRGTDDANAPSAPQLLDQLGIPAAAVPQQRPTLAGRAVELDRLAELSKDAREGRPVLALISGEAGIGKSRLAAEFALRAHAEGANVLWGRCHEQALVPYEPFVEALRQYAAVLDNDGLAQLAHAAGGEFLSIAPELGRRLSGASFAPQADDPQARRYRLFESVADVLALAARARPLVLVLEDLHWSDRSTALLLSHISVRPGPSPLLIVGTLRDTEIGEEHPMAAQLAAGDPAAARRLIELRGLAASETAQIAAEVAPARENSERLHAETGGNPLFLLELLRTPLEDKAQQFPERIADVIDRRLRRLGSDAATVLGVGAVLGHSFDLDLIARISGLSEARLLDAVDEAIAARVIEEVPGQPRLVSFTHALLREVRYRQHSAPRRLALHGAAAEAIQAIHTDTLDEHLAELAGHLEAAVRDRASALEAFGALHGAGIQAARRQAFEDAAGLLARGRDLFERAEPPDSERCDLLLALAEAARAANQIDRARSIAVEAARIARTLHDGHRLSRAALCHAGPLLIFKAGRPDYEDIALLEEALATLPEDALASRVQLLGRLCISIYYSDRFDEVQALSEQAMELAERSGNAESLAWAYYARMWASLDPDHIGDRIEAITRLVQLIEQSDNPQLACDGYLAEFGSLFWQGRPDLVAGKIATHRDAILASGIPIFHWFIDAMDAVLAVVEGRGEEAEPLIMELAKSGAAIPSHDLPRFAAIPLLALRQDQGRLGELVDTLEYVATSNPGLPAWRAVLAQALIAADRAPEAQEVLDKLAVDDFAWLRRDVNWLWVITASSAACFSLRDVRIARVLYRLLAPLPDQGVIAGPALAFWGPLDRFVGPLAALVGRHEEAARRFDNAIRALDAIGARPLAAATRRDYAIALVDAGRPEHAAERAAEALAVAEELGLAGIAVDAQAILASLGEAAETLP